MKSEWSWKVTQYGLESRGYWIDKERLGMRWHGTERLFWPNHMSRKGVNLQDFRLHFIESAMRHLYAIEEPFDYALIRQSFAVAQQHQRRSKLWSKLYKQIKTEQFPEEDGLSSAGTLMTVGGQVNQILAQRGYHNNYLPESILVPAK